MENVLNELWNGGIVPKSDCRPQTEEYRQLKEYIDRHRLTLVATLDDDQFAVFDTFDACYAEYLALSEEAIFSYAYKLGMRTALEVLHGISGNDK